MIRVKHVVFLSRSHLAHNVMELLIASVNKRVSLSCYTDFTVLRETPIAHTISLMIVDHNVFLLGGSEHQLLQDLNRRFFKSARKILLHGREADFDAAHMRDAGFSHFLRKPFLPEELLQIMQASLKG